MGNESDPWQTQTGRYIFEALKWASQQCGWPSTCDQNLPKYLKRNIRAQVVGTALGYIIRQRKGEKCEDKDLAYADHYLQTRIMVACHGPVACAITMAVIVPGYEATKKVKEIQGRPEDMKSDDQCSRPVPADLTSIQWGERGAADGLYDWTSDSIDLMKNSVKSTFPQLRRL